MDWTQYTTDPCDPETRLKIHAYLNKIRETAGKDDVKWILKTVVVPAGISYPLEFASSA